MLSDLATWHLINWLYTPRMLHQAEQLRTNYSDTRMHDRLLAVLKQRLGHRDAQGMGQTARHGADQDSRRSAGNRITSRMLGLSVSSIIKRSMPMPQPPVGGMPYSSARTKSWS